MPLEGHAVAPPAAMLFDSTASAWLFDREYIPFVRVSLATAAKQILAQQFVIDARPDADANGEVRYLLHALGAAACRSLDVRVLLAQVVVEKPFPVDVNASAARFLIARGVRVRRLPERFGVQMHTKCTVVDNDLVIVGSHNWTSRAFSQNSETSLALKSSECASYVTERFESLWSRAEDY